MARVMTLEQRERRNLNRRINYAIKTKGLAFDIDVIPKREEFKTEEEYIQSLKELRGEELWEQGESYYEDEDDIPYIDDEILLAVEDIINFFDSSNFRNNYSLMVGRYKRDILRAQLDNAISLQGRDAVASYLNEASIATDIIDLVNRAIYDSDSISSADNNPYLNEFIEIIHGSALSPLEAQELSTDYGY